MWPKAWKHEYCAREERTVQVEERISLGDGSEGEVHLHTVDGYLIKHTRTAILSYHLHISESYMVIGANDQLCSVDIFGRLR
jgi:hypothetical protein